MAFVCFHQYIIPEAGIDAGKMFAYGVNLTTDKGMWQVVDNSTFALHPDGDNILVYCINADGEPHFINAVSYSGGFVAAGLESYNISESALPSRLSALGSVSFEGHPNWLYKGVQEADRAELIPAFSNATNWKGSDVVYQISSASRHVALASGLIGLVTLSFLQHM
jgi:hypothetical protein